MNGALPKLLIKKLNNQAIVPKKGSPFAVGYDIYRYNYF